MADKTFSEAGVDFFLHEGRVTDLVQVVASGKGSADSDRAAKKLIDMYLDGNLMVGLDDLAYVGDHANEPHKSEANGIISRGI